MKFTKLQEVSVSKDNVSVFGGYNHNIVSSEGESFDMKNMSSANYPNLSPRNKRTTYKATTSANGIIAKDSLCYVDGTDLYIGDTKVTGVTLTNSKKQLVSMGAYILVFPDGVYVNTIDTTDKGKLENTVATTQDITFSMCNVNGEAYSTTTIQDDPPDDPSNMDLWIDTSQEPNVLMQYSELQGMWVSIATSYVKIASKGIAKGFKEYDAVKISGIDSALTQLKGLEGQTSILWQVHEDAEGNGAGDYIVVIGIINTVASQSATITVSRTIPKMDFCVESGNRLWGCRYGTDLNGNQVNEIYASKLGDFRNFNFFAGTSADSYALSCGTDGAWTGAISYLGYPMFFKETSINKIYGNYPSSYQLKTTICKGVMKGAAESLVICNDYLIYKSREGICIYDGSLPSEISASLGQDKYNGIDSSVTDTLRNGAIAGFNENKYYISMKSDVDNKWHLFVYDLSKGMWHKEDNLRVDSFCSYKGELYYVDHSTHKINTVLGSGSIGLEQDVEWMAESNVLGLNRKQNRYSVATPGKKYIGQILVRMSMDIGAETKFYIQYDSQGDFVEVASLTGTTLRPFFVPIRPKRCDHFRIRIVGKGGAKIQSYTKIIEQGSDY